MPTPERGSTTALPVLGDDPLSGFTADGIMLAEVVRVAATSRTYRARRDSQALQVWVAGDELASDMAFVARFRQEAVLLETLRHVHVELCEGFRTWTKPNGKQLIALVEEASDGVAVSELARREPLPVRDVLRLLHQACSGLAAAHRLGLVHGDLSPDAVLVTAGGSAKLRGFALGVGGYSAERAERGLIGSPDFMAPEVGRGQQPSALSDLYGIGAVLATLLIGEVPFPAVTALEAIHLHGSAPVPALAASYPEYAVVAPLIARLMAKDAAQRWMDVEDLARELLVLSGQVSGDLRCRQWSARRSVPLATLVQTTLDAQERAASSPAKASSSGGTTTISRKSTEFFRNPELFRPTGLTPATGLPVLPPPVANQSSAASTSAPRSARRMGPVAPSAPAATASSSTLVQPEKTPYLARLASAPPPGTPSTPTANEGGQPCTRSNPMPLLVSVLCVVAVTATVLWFMSGRGEQPLPPSPAKVPATSVEPAVGDSLAQQLAAIAAMSVRDPAAALELAAKFRREHPTADHAHLPVAVHLVIEGPQSAAVRATRDGQPIAMSNGVLCRTPGEALALRIEAAGFHTQEVLIPASNADEVTQVVTVLDEPRWALPPFAPAWVRLLPAPAGVLLASDRKVVLLAAADGHEIRRLDHASAALLPEQLAWASVLSVSPERLQLGVGGGQCIVANNDDLTQVREIHRGQASVLALRVLPLTLRLGEDGIFVLERDGSGFALAADNHERRLWNHSLKGGMVPWFTGQGDRLVVVGEHQIQRFSQEGEEVASVALPAARTAEPVDAGVAGLLVPTTKGILRVASKMSSLPGLEQAVNAVVADTTMLVAASGRGVFTWQIDTATLTSGWMQRELMAADHHVAHLALTKDQVIAVDEAGLIRVLARADGALIRTVRVGAPLLAPPQWSSGALITVVAPGVVCAY